MNEESLERLIEPSGHSGLWDHNRKGLIERFGKGLKIITLTAIVAALFSVFCPNYSIAKTDVNDVQQNKSISNEDGEKSKKNYDIAFQSFRDSNLEIYVMDSNGNNVRRLTNYKEADLVPLWSPTEQKIAYMSFIDKKFQVCIMNADGTGQKIISKSPGDNIPESWSPDGKKLAYCSKEDESWDICTVNADGTGLKRLTDGLSYNRGASWSPDGKRISFISIRDGNWEIYVMNSDGTEQKRLTDNSCYDTEPQWSPKGDKIMFMTERDKVNGKYIKRAYTMNPDGSNQKSLTDSTTSEGLTAWSPDGSKIAFSRYEGIMTHIYTINVDGTSLQKLTDTTYRWGCRLPRWTPDNRITYESMDIITGKNQIHIMNSDGTGKRNLTGETTNDSQAFCSPVLR